MKLSELFEQYFYGPEGKTLFWRPYPKKIVVHDDSGDLIRARDEDLDDRSLALVSAMISENYIDRILKLLLPSFRLNDKPGSAASKIELLAAFNIIPEHLTTAAELLNTTRNRFAHNLKLTSFAGLEDDPKGRTVTNRMRGLCKARKIIISTTGNEIRTLFEAMFLMATTGILRYEENVHFYSDFIRGQEFIKAVEEIHSAEVRNHDQIVLEALRLHQSAPIRDEPPAIA